MNLQEVLGQAEALGFKVEEQRWTSEDYDLEYNEFTGRERRRWKKKREFCYKLIFPNDYPHPPAYVDDVAGALAAIRAYERRYEDMAENIRISEQTQRAMEELRRMMEGG